MSTAHPTTKELDALIEEVTVDAYNDSEQLTASGLTALRIAEAGGYAEIAGFLAEPRSTEPRP